MKHTHLYFLLQNIFNLKSYFLEDFFVKGLSLIQREAVHRQIFIVLRSMLFCKVLETLVYKMFFLFVFIQCMQCHCEFIKACADGNCVNRHNRFTCWTLWYCMISLLVCDKSGVVFCKQIRHQISVCVQTQRVSVRNPFTRYTFIC